MTQKIPNTALLYAEDRCVFCNGKATNIFVYEVPEADYRKIIRVCAQHNQAPPHSREITAEELRYLQLSEDTTLQGKIMRGERDGYFIINGTGWSDREGDAWRLNRKMAGEPVVFLHKIGGFASPTHALAQAAEGMVSWDPYLIDPLKHDHNKYQRHVDFLRDKLRLQAMGKWKTEQMRIISPKVTFLMAQELASKVVETERIIRDPQLLEVSMVQDS